MPLRCTVLSTQATAGSARTLSDGATIRNFPGAKLCVTGSASFPQARSTSPMPRSTKVSVEPRAPESRIGTFL